jgi:hypothetical protein
VDSDYPVRSVSEAVRVAQAVAAVTPVAGYVALREHQP